MKPLGWPRDPLIWAGALIAIAASALALFAGRYLPAIDWSNHVGLIAILAHGDETGASAYFTRSYAPTPYLLFYALSALLGHFMPVDVSARVVIAASAGLWTLGAAHLAEATGRSPRLGLIAPIGLFSLSMGWGFGSFVLASPLLFFALGSAERVFSLDRHARCDRRAYRLRLFGLQLALSLVFLGHALVYAAAALLIGVRALGLALARVRRWVVDGAWTLTSVSDALLGAWPSAVLGLPSVLSYLRHPWLEAGTASALELTPLKERFDNLGGHLLDRGSMEHRTVMLLWAGLVALLFVVGMFRPRRAGARPSLGLEAYSAMLAALYFFGPMTLQSVWLVYPRFAVLAAVSATLLPQVDLARWRGAVFFVLALALVGANANLNRGHVATFSEWAKPFDRVRSLIPAGSSVLPLTVVGPDDRANLHPALGSLYFYLLADKARYVPFLFDNPGLPVHRRDGAEHPRAPFWRSPESYDPYVHGRDYDYLVLRGRGLVDSTVAAGLHEKLQDVDGWVVFRTRNPPVAPQPSATDASRLRERPLRE